MVVVSSTSNRTGPRVRTNPLCDCQLVRLAVAGLYLSLLSASGCQSIGPDMMARDRFSYSGALTESWKHQMLLNLIKTRYLDLPIYLEVGQIVSGYSLETSGRVSGQVAQVGRADQFLGLSGSATFTDRPTITYTPLTGEKFLNGFLTPIQPAKVLSLVQSGYAADFILDLCVDSLNGVRNRPARLGSQHQADPDFSHALALLRDIQDASAMGLRVDRIAKADSATVLFFRSEKITPETEAKIKELRNLLGLTDGPACYRLVQSPLRGGAGELSIDTRSLAQVMAALSFGVDIPPEHTTRKLVPPIAEAPAERPPLLRIHTGSAQPADPFVAVTYEGAWFWIANDDWRSKRTFSSILFLFTLADTGGNDRLPVLTIPTQ